jgi:hypothetical protein
MKNWLPLQPDRPRKSLMTLKMNFFMDPGHGWLEVNQIAQAALDINHTSLSAFSYTKDGVIYAEEDCDINIVMAAHHRKLGTLPTIIGKHLPGNLPIRSFSRCTGQETSWKADREYVAEFT